MPSLSPFPLRLSLLKPPLSGNLYATRPVALTLSSGVVNDAYRAPGTQGDGPAGTTGIWPAATNLNDNGNATTNLTGVTDHSSTTTRATTGVVKFGTTAFNVVSGNAAANEGPSQPINGGLGSTLYTVSAWVWLISGAATVRTTLSDSVAGKQGGSAVALTATPQKVTVTATTGIAGITEASYIETTIQQAGTWRIGGWQVETGAVATPYVQTDGADATRPAGRIQVPVGGILPLDHGWIASRVQMGWASSGSTNLVQTGWDLRSGSNAVMQEVAWNGTQWAFKIGSTGGVNIAPSAFVVGDYQTFIQRYSNLGATNSSSINGGAFNTGVGGAITNYAALMDIGGQSVATRQISGNEAWVAFGSAMLPDSAPTFFANIGNNKPTVRQLKQAFGGRVGVWDGRTGTMQVSVSA